MITSPKIQDVYRHLYVCLLSFAQRFVSNEEAASITKETLFLAIEQEKKEGFVKTDKKREIWLADLIKNALMKALREQCTSGQKSDLRLLSSIRKANIDWSEKNNVIFEKYLEIVSSTHDALPEGHKTIFLLTFEGLSNKEIAGKLSISEEEVITVRAQIGKTVREK
jgi:DNA-directed RNA polymerase specialized sigma24 family protein